MRITQFLRVGRLVAKTLRAFGYARSWSQEFLGLVQERAHLAQRSL